jgi:hypothetical protein
MSPFTASVTRRDRKRRRKSGAAIVQTRFVVNYRELRSGKRRQIFFERYKDAIAKRDELLASVAMGTYSQRRSDLTVAEAANHWLENRRAEVKKGTWDSYRHAVSYITRPLLVGTQRERYNFTRRGRKPKAGRARTSTGPSIQTSPERPIRPSTSGATRPNTAP